MSETALKETALCEFHRRHAARMVPFAGYQMPVQYPAGILGEHHVTRGWAGLFDVSHMGQVRLWPKSGSVADAALALEALIPSDIVGQAEGRQRYGLFTTPEGGLVDDLMIATRSDHLFLVVNASRKHVDMELLESGLGRQCEVELVEGRSLLAIQGPDSEDILSRLIPEVASMNFMDSLVLDHAGKEIWVSRSGYTGEDGFELSVPDDLAVGLAGDLLEQRGVLPVGLGARDSLRLEAGLCLYGNDIDETTSPVEAGLSWAIQKARRAGGAREGGFPGDARILAELAEGTGRRRVGIRPVGRVPMRQGAPIYGSETGDDRIGEVTSGGFGPTVGGPVAMGYVETGFAAVGTMVYGQVRNRRYPAEVQALPFVKTRFKKMKG